MNVPPTYRTNIFGEINDERLYQDRKIGGPSYDDRLTELDWKNLIYKYSCSTFPSSAIKHNFRTRMIKTAALAIAAIESYERKSKLSKVS